MKNECRERLKTAAVFGGRQEQSYAWFNKKNATCCTHANGRVASGEPDQAGEVAVHRQVEAAGPEEVAVAPSEHMAVTFANSKHASTKEGERGLLRRHTQSSKQRKTMASLGSVG